MKEEIRKYIELKLKLIKFEATEKVADIRSKLFFDIVFIFLCFCFLFFFGFTLALLLNAIFDSNYLGFVVFTSFLLLTMLFLLWKRKKIIRKIFMNYLDRNIPS
jgi:hypothetical protein